MTIVINPRENEPRIGTAKPAKKKKCCIEQTNTGKGWLGINENKIKMTPRTYLISIPKLLHPKFAKDRIQPTYWHHCDNELKTQ